MPAELHRSDIEREEQSKLHGKKGIVTGIRDRSEVEAMIQRYLELAQSALKEDIDTPAQSA